MKNLLLKTLIIFFLIGWWSCKKDKIPEIGTYEGTIEEHVSRGVVTLDVDSNYQFVETEVDTTYISQVIVKIEEDQISFTGINDSPLEHGTNIEETFTYDGNKAYYYIYQGGGGLSGSYNFIFDADGNLLIERDDGYSNPEFYEKTKLKFFGVKQ